MAIFNLEEIESEAGRYTAKCSIRDIYEIIEKSPLLVTPSELFRTAQKEHEISSATFWRIWKKLKRWLISTDDRVKRYSVNPSLPPPEHSEPLDRRNPTKERKAQKKPRKERKMRPHDIAASNMPPLHHTLPGERFDPSKSEVLQYLYTLPEIQSMIPNLVFNEARKSMTYDSNTGKWTGKNYSKTITNNENN